LQECSLARLAVNYSVATKDYTCEGFSSANGALGERDHGRLQIEYYPFWVSIGDETSDGRATFQSTWFSLYEGDLRAMGEGNLTIYVGTSSGGSLSFKRATNELLVAHDNLEFMGNCQATL
jgi:hypothetical protein